MYSMRMDEAQATQPSNAVILSIMGTFHFSGTLPAEIMVPSFRIVMRTIAITGRAPYLGILSWFSRLPS